MIDNPLKALTNSLKPGHIAREHALSWKEDVADDLARQLDQKAREYELAPLADTLRIACPNCAEPIALDVRTAHRDLIPDARELSKLVYCDECANLLRLRAACQEKTARAQRNLNDCARKADALRLALERNPTESAPLGADLDRNEIAAADYRAAMAYTQTEIEALTGKLARLAEKGKKRPSHPLPAPPQPPPPQPEPAPVAAVEFDEVPF